MDRRMFLKGMASMLVLPKLTWKEGETVETIMMALDPQYKDVHLHRMKAVACDKKRLYDMGPSYKTIVKPDHVIFHYRLEDITFTNTLWGVYRFASNGVYRQSYPFQFSVPITPGDKLYITWSIHANIPDFFERYPLPEKWFNDRTVEKSP